MIDYVSIILPPSYANRFRSNPTLEFRQEYISETAELIGGLRCEYQNLKIEIDTGNNVIIRGSIHQFFKDGKNHTDFTYQDCKMAIEKLCSELNFNANDAIIRAVEFGVNLSTKIHPKDIIESLLFHKAKGGDLKNFLHQPVIRKGNLSKCERDRYEIKIYDKGAQMRLDYFLLRYEIKIKKHAQLIVLGINTLQDLTKEDSFFNFSISLIATWNQITLMPTEETTPNAPNSFFKFKDFGYWKKLKKKNTKAKFNEEHLLYKEMLKKQNKNLHNNLRILIEKKTRELSNFS